MKSNLFKGQEIIRITQNKFKIKTLIEFWLTYLNFSVLIVIKIGFKMENVFVWTFSCYCLIISILILTHLFLIILISLHSTTMHEVVETPWNIFMVNFPVKMC